MEYNSKHPCDLCNHSDNCTLKYKGKDSWGRYVYEDQNGKLWKHINCLSTREKCIERQDTLYSSYNNEYDGEPDCHMNPIYLADFLI